MDWEEFAIEIDGKYKTKIKYRGFGPDYRQNRIKMEDEDQAIDIIKKYPVEKEKMPYTQFEKLSYTLTNKETLFTDNGTILRKSYFKKLVNENKSPIKVKGDITTTAFIQSEYLSDLLHYPNSRLILKDNKIIFKMKFMGPLDEDLRFIHRSLYKLMNILVGGTF